MNNMKALLRMILCAGFTAGAIFATTGAGAAPKAYFITPIDGAVVSSPVKVVFGLSGMGVAPAGVNKDKTGHHHLLINTGLPNLKTSIPKDDKHVHFGDGQTEAEVTLPPGKHTLQILLADFAHVPHNPPVMSERITITVR